jgi:hypothetical protein
LAKVILYNDIEPLIHQMIIQDGGAFIHASCVAKNGSAVVISGWGGAGKTSVATELSRSNEWEIVSDNLCLIESRGKTQPYPKRVQIYPYNLDSQKGKKNSGSLSPGSNQLEIEINFTWRKISPAASSP